MAVAVFTSHSPPTAKSFFLLTNTPLKDSNPKDNNNVCRNIHHSTLLISKGRSHISVRSTCQFLLSAYTKTLRYLRKLSSVK
jgi:hypothetical protein